MFDSGMDENDKRTYRIWAHMKGGCLNPRHPRFPENGARGISVDWRWLEYSNFLADMGSAPKGLTLRRRRKDRNYGPKNCYWGPFTPQRRPAIPAECARPECGRPFMSTRVTHRFCSELCRVTAWRAEQVMVPRSVAELVPEELELVRRDNPFRHKPHDAENSNPKTR